MNLFTTNEQLQIKRNVELILTTAKGSCPLMRDFGLDVSFIDMPTTKTQAVIRQEIYDQISRYEPRATIKSITFEHDNLNGVIKPKVVIA